MPRNFTGAPIRRPLRSPGKKQTNCCCLAKSLPDPSTTAAITSTAIAPRTNPPIIVGLRRLPMAVTGVFYATRQETAYLGVVRVSEQFVGVTARDHGLRLWVE